MPIPSFDLTRQNERLKDELAAAFQSVASEGVFILGERVKRFEAEIAGYLKVKHAIGVANGSDALLLALMAIDLKPGDEVIIPGFTFFATAGSVARLGGVPVFVDVRPGTYNINPEEIREKITPKTKAIIPVHLFGNPAEMDPIMALAGEYKLAVIEDVAQSLGAKYKDRMTGTIGKIGCYSFFPTKNLGCFGDGGLVTTDDDDFAAKLRTLRQHGAKRKYYNELLGINSRLDALQAAILSVKLPYLDKWLAARRRIVLAYRSGLQGFDPVKLPLENTVHTYNQFTVVAQKRDELQKYLAQQEIGSTIYYPRGLHQQPIFIAMGYGGASLPVTDSICQKVLSLPLFPEMTAAEVEQVVEKVREFYERKQ